MARDERPGRAAKRFHTSGLCDVEIERGEQWARFSVEDIARLIRARDRRAVRLVRDNLGRVWGDINRMTISRDTVENLCDAILGRAPKGGKGR